MISICCCAINAKFDVDIFVRAIHQHNPDVDFEIVLVHDDRVNDGSAEHFAALAVEFPRLKLITHTHEDTVDYLTKLVSYYDTKNILTKDIREAFKLNIVKFSKHELFNHQKAFLWLTSGVLYHKAVMASKGDTLIITPADFIYLFRLKDLQTIVETKKRDGHFYGKPNAIWARLSNDDPAWLKTYVNDLHNGVGTREGYRWDTKELFRDYLKNPQTPENLSLCDVYRNRVIPLSEFGDFKQVYEFNNNSFRIGGVQAIPSFHGFHVMTRKTYDAIGGFTEEWYGRAFADDKMTRLGRQFGGGSLPYDISVAWCGQSEIVNSTPRPLPENWQETLRQVDPLCDEHPMSNRDMPKYLHEGVFSNNDVSAVVVKHFSQGTPPVRIL